MFYAQKVQYILMRCELSFTHGMFIMVLGM